MPNTTDDPQSPPRSHSFSTCPEETAGPWSPSSPSWHQPTHDRDLDTEMQEERLAEGEALHALPAPVSALAPESITATDSMTDGDPQSITSRDTTLSPNPHTGIMDRLSLPPRVRDLDSTKQAEMEEDGLLIRHGSLHERIDSTDSMIRPNASLREGQSSMAIESDRSLESGISDTWEDDYAMSSLYEDMFSMRVIPITPSSYLRPGSRFHGTQQSERQVYDVQVEIKHVDLRESFMCGYLRIQGLTEDHPTLTTYFEGEIIGPKYSFITGHDSWGATDKIDLNHWAKFNAFRPFQKQARKGPIFIRDVAQRENVFMRWKEHFLVPDHRVKTIVGASFEGFYYICFNQIKGEVSGIYFHAKSEKFQQLELKHVEDKGCFSAVEFR